jgi:acyl-CoA synthetase (NDP forming)
MEKFFSPQRVAVVGVSTDPANLAQGIVTNLLEFGYQGEIFLVGRKRGKLKGLPIFPSLRDLPEPVDLVAILTPAPLVPSLVADCGKLGVTRVVVESAGFSELSAEGLALEEEIRALLQQYHMRLVGPNGLGLINMETGLALPFAHVRPRPRKGHISIVSQSGGVGMHLSAWMVREGLGLNKFLSLGNKLDVTENDALAFLLTDPGTEAVYLYLEGLSDGRELLSLAHQAQKPIYLQQPNVGPETATIAHSHTASLTTDERVLEAACRQSGMILIKSQAQFLTAAKLVGQPPVKGRRVVALSRTGGEAVVTAYACRHWGFQLPPISPHLVELIKERSRAGVIHPTNPIDLGDIFDFTVYSEIIAALCGDPEVDAVLLNYGPMAEFEQEPARDMARAALDTARAAKKPLALTVLATLQEEEFFRETLGVPVFHFPEEALQSLAYSRLWAAREVAAPWGETAPWPQAEKITALLASLPKGQFLSLPQALSLIAALGLPVAPWQAAASPEEAMAAAEGLGYPVVLKLAAPSLVHKTEEGGVVLNLKDAEAVSLGFADLAAVAARTLAPGEPWQVVVMSQVTGGRELLLGARQDRAFGPVLAFGAGGTETEILEDVALRVAPVNGTQARRMMAETRIGRILAGSRNQAAADLEALSRGLTLLSQLMVHFPQIQEVDLNPVLAFPGQTGILTLDARLRVGQEG